MMTKYHTSISSAAVWEWNPLVRIPGLPATGAVNLSAYLVGLYNFLLSVVGIVAVMMLIIGGMRYITAAGNQAALGDAKDIIMNAIFGLLLALLSWVFVSTINPDVLYIKQPGSTFSTATYVNLGSCYTSYTAPNCTCRDGTIITATIDETTCDEDCKNNCSALKSYPCIAEAGPIFIGSEAYKRNDNKCSCIDGNESVEPSSLAITSGANCNEVCSDATKASDGEYHCGWNYLVVRVNIDGETASTPFDGGSIFYELDPTKSKLMDMFLTNEGGWSRFKNKPESYTVGGRTYECAIMVSARRTFLGVAGDYKNYFWVLPGTVIHGGIYSEDAFSLEKDICGKFVQCCHGEFAFGSDSACEVEFRDTPGCDWEYDDPDHCAINRSTLGSDDILMYSGASRLFKMKYKKGIIDDCYSSNKGLDNERSCNLAIDHTTYGFKEALR